MSALKNVAEQRTMGGINTTAVAQAATRLILSRRFVAIAATLVFLYFLLTEILFVSMDGYLVAGGGPTEVRNVAGRPAFNFVFAVAALPMAYVFAYGNNKHPKRLHHLLGAALGSLVLLIWVSSYLQLMCAYSSRDMTNLCDLALKIQGEVEEKFGPDKMWIIKGNLLAIARKQSDINYLIGNDHDFDFCAVPELFDGGKLAQHLDEQRYVFEKNLINERGTRKVTIYPKGLALYKYHSGPPMVDIDECDAPKSYLPVKGCNGGTFKISDKWEEWLNGEYGPDWRKPVNLNHKGLCAISSWW